MSNVWVDAEGHLHLRIRKIGDTWYCSEVRTVEPTGYGMHRFYIIGRIDELDRNVIFAPFLYKDATNEVDIEFTRWGSTEPAAHNAQYAIQPFYESGNIHTFRMDLSGTWTTHYFDWSYSNILFKSIHGHHQEPPDPGLLIQEWNNTGTRIPDERMDLNIHINLWLNHGYPPSNSQDVEVVVVGVDYPCYQSPRNVNAGNGTHTNYVRITWDAVESATAYEVWRGTAAGSEYASIIADNVTTTRYDDVSAVPSHVYYYWVKGKNAFGSGRFSNADAGWCGGTNLGAVNFFYDGFARADGVETAYTMKWLREDLDTAGDSQSYCSNDMWFVMPGGGEWNWTALRPADTDFGECAFNVMAGDGVTARIDLGAWQVFEAANAPDYDAIFSMSILNVPVTANPWELSATGISLFARLDVESSPSSNIVFRLYRKYTNDDCGIELFITNVGHIAGATVALTFDADDARVMYNGDTLFHAAHGVTVGDWTNWYVGYAVQNAASSRCRYFFDNAEIVGPGVAFSDCFADDFTGASGAGVDGEKWFNTSGSAIITNNMCRLAPGDSDWAGANLGMKSDAWNPLRMDPGLSPLLFSARLMDIEVTAANATEPDMMFKTEWYLERNHADSWDYDGTSLSTEVEIDIDAGVTTLNVHAYRYDKAETRATLFTSDGMAFVPGGLFEFMIDETNFAAGYAGVSAGENEHGLDVPAVFSRGVFPVLIAENYAQGRGALYLDDAGACVPEPLCACGVVVWLTYVVRSRGV